MVNCAISAKICVKIAQAETLGDFCNFSIKITNFYADFGQNSYFKAITYQLKAFKISLNVLNRINEVQVLQVL